MAKELVVFTNNGQTYHFKGVTDFRPTTTGFSFTYHGVATGIDRQATFNNTSTAGYALAEEMLEAETISSTKNVLTMAPKHYDSTTFVHGNGVSIPVSSQI